MPLKIGDRCIVTLQTRDTVHTYSGQIVGETRDKRGWWVRRDIFKHPTSIHKAFVQPAPPPGPLPVTSTVTRIYPSGATETVIEGPKMGHLALPYHEWDFYRAMLGDEGGGP